MDITLISQVVFAFAFTLIPSLLMSYFVGFSYRVFACFFCIFSAICVYYGVMPSWFTGIVILITASLLYIRFKENFNR